MAGDFSTAAGLEEVRKRISECLTYLNEVTVAVNGTQKPAPQQWTFKLYQEKAGPEQAIAVFQKPKPTQSYYSTDRFTRLDPGRLVLCASDGDLIAEAFYNNNNTRVELARYTVNWDALAKKKGKRRGAQDVLDTEIELSVREKDPKQYGSVSDARITVTRTTTKGEYNIERIALDHGEGCNGFHQDFVPPAIKAAEAKQDRKRGWIDALDSVRDALRSEEIKLRDALQADKIFQDTLSDLTQNVAKRGRKGTSKFD